MADRIMAPPPGSGSGSGPTDPQPSAADLLENKLDQLHSLLTACYGDDGFLAQGAPFKDFDNLIWLAADLVSEAQALNQLIARQ
jgi:hypothetical protein